MLYLTHIYSVRLMDILSEKSVGINFITTIVAVFFSIICADIWYRFIELPAKKLLKK